LNTVGQDPTAADLQGWRNKFNIPFHVAASPGDFGDLFYESPSFPNVVIIDGNQRLVFAKIKAKVSEWFDVLKNMDQ